MKILVSRLGSTLMGAAALVVAGCAGFRMGVPADLAQSSAVLEARGRPWATGLLVREDFQLGEYFVVDVRRDVDSKSRVTIGPWSKDEQTSGVSYGFVAAGAKRSGRCEGLDRAQRLGPVSWANLEVTCSCGEGADRAEAWLGPSGHGLLLGGKAYQFQPIHDVQGGGQSGTPTGFRADLHGPQGAVEVVFPGQVWLSRQLDGPTRERLACVFAGLMLYQPPSI